MKSIYPLILVLMCLGCGSHKSEPQDSVDDINEEVRERSWDSIPATLLYDYERQENGDLVTVVLSNPYNDTVRLDDEYYIYELYPDTIVLKGHHTASSIDPHSSCKFQVSLGLDSIWYNKDRSYLFTFTGRLKDRNVLYRNSTLRLGRINKKNGRMCVVVDTIYLPVMLVPDTDPDPVVIESENAIDSMSETEWVAE